MTRDTWGGDENSPTSFNRWNYGYGNPVNLTDPSGKYPSAYAEFTSGDGSTQFAELDEILINRALEEIAKAYLRGYYVGAATVEGCPPVWDYNNALASIVSQASNPGMSPVTVFYKIHGGKITFRKFANNPTWYADVSGKNLINIYKGGSLTTAETYRWLSGRAYALSTDVTRSDWDPANWLETQDKYVRLITHEVGHAFDNAIKAKAPSKTVGSSDQYLPAPVSPYLPGGFCGTKDEGWQWRLESQKDFDTEIFADMYLGWVYQCFSYTDMRRWDFMNNYMPYWIYDVVKSK